MSNIKLPKETRFSNFQNFSIETREENGSELMHASGYPVVFEKETFIGFEGRGFYEIIDKNAFDGADMSDVVLRYNHSENFMIMARTRNKSLRLSIDEQGLRMDSDLIPTSFNKDIYLATRAGLLTEGSFAFTVKEQTKEKRADGYILRRITKIGSLFDVSICDNGAYGDTSIYARSLELMEIDKEQPEGEKREGAIIKARDLELMEISKEQPEGEKRVKHQNFYIQNLIRMYGGNKK